MKTFNMIIKHLLLILLIGITAISCKEETINFYVDITNLRNETVYFFVENGSTESIPHGQELTKDFSLDSENDYNMILKMQEAASKPRHVGGP